mmetsp:Transcript_1871/g.3550  ORF Transcript_1871/g.3550 Transcript_1871/m.3550 type:complete len:225 (+) Transcript_1871:196-870(+)
MDVFSVAPARRSTAAVNETSCFITSSACLKSFSSAIFTRIMLLIAIADALKTFISGMSKRPESSPLLCTLLWSLEEVSSVKGSTLPNKVPTDMFSRFAVLLIDAKKSGDSRDIVAKRCQLSSSFGGDLSDKFTSNNMSASGSVCVDEGGPCEPSSGALFELLVRRILRCRLCLVLLRLLKDFFRTPVGGDSPVVEGEPLSWDTSELDILFLLLLYNLLTYSILL